MPSSFQRLMTPSGILWIMYRAYNQQKPLKRIPTILTISNPNVVKSLTIQNHNTLIESNECVWYATIMRETHACTHVITFRVFFVDTQAISLNIQIVQFSSVVGTLRGFSGHCRSRMLLLLRVRNVTLLLGYALEEKQITSVCY